MTIMENRARLAHEIPVGTLVELETGVRLFVVHHSRDCDGTPLYDLCWNPEYTEDHPRDIDLCELLVHGSFGWLRHYSKESLKVVRPWILLQNEPAPKYLRVLVKQQSGHTRIAEYGTFNGVTGFKDDCGDFLLKAIAWQYLPR